MALAVIGIGLTGDPITTKMSIGCDATNRTAPSPPVVGGLVGEELGIDAHNVNHIPPSTTTQWSNTLIEIRSRHLPLTKRLLPTGAERLRYQHHPLRNDVYHRRRPIQSSKHGQIHGTAIQAINRPECGILLWPQSRPPVRCRQLPLPPISQFHR